jgi:hypothetical protein
LQWSSEKCWEGHQKKLDASILTELLLFSFPFFSAHLQNTLCLINAASEGKVVHGCMLDDTLLVDDEKPSQGYAILCQNSIGFADFLLEVSNQGVVKVTQATLLRNPVR